MKFAVAVHGTRGDVEPAAAVALELRSRGHQVRVAVPPNLVAFTESAGLESVISYGPDSQQQLEAEVFREWLKPRNPLTMIRQGREYITDGWQGMGETLKALAYDADAIVTGTTYQEVAANVAEFYGIPLAALHYFPARANSHSLPVRLPLAVARPVFTLSEWAHWRLLRPADDAQRARLGLPKNRVRASRRIIDAGTLEIQAYDEALFPGLAQEWGISRPFTGSMTLGISSPEDARVSHWVSMGSAPIYFGFGSMPVENPSEAVQMISEVCAEIGERALICSGVLDIGEIPATDRVLVVPNVNHTHIFPQCRAIVHHGGAGTTAASVRSGVPTLVLWVSADQIIWATAIKRLGVGTARRFSETTHSSLRKDLQTVLGPACVSQARALAAQLTPSARSVTKAADLIESLPSR